VDARLHSGLVAVPVGLGVASVVVDPRWVVDVLVRVVEPVSPSRDEGVSVDRDAAWLRESSTVVLLDLSVELEAV
jgi:hypothetical protein